MAYELISETLAHWLHRQSLHQDFFRSSKSRYVQVRTVHSSIKHFVRGCAYVSSDFGIYITDLILMSP